jgi:hypothetical protein
MDRFFIDELQVAQQADIQLVFRENELQSAYEDCKNQFDQEFSSFMEKIDAIPIDDSYE